MITVCAAMFLGSLRCAARRSSSVFPGAVGAVVDGGVGAAVGGGVGAAVGAGGAVGAGVPGTGVASMPAPVGGCGGVVAGAGATSSSTSSSTSTSSATNSTNSITMVNDNALYVGYVIGLSESVGQRTAGDGVGLQATKWLEPDWLRIEHSGG